MTEPKKKAPRKRTTKKADSTLEVIPSPKTPSLVLSQPTYELFKKGALVVLPAIGTLYFVLSQIWGLPDADKVVGTIGALTLFLGGSTAVSSSRYNNSDAKYDGSIDVSEENDIKKFLLNLHDGDVQNLDKKKDVTFKINK